jgi:hypothetical protein
MRNDNLDRRDSGIGSTMIAVIAGIAVLALLFMWAPWSGPKVADNTAPGTTVGSSTRPSTPVAPVGPATTPTTPAERTTR